MLGAPWCYSLDSLSGCSLWRQSSRGRPSGGTWDPRTLQVGSVPLGSGGRSRELPASMRWKCVNVRGYRCCTDV